jgi:hypothetical protein
VLQDEDPITSVPRAFSGTSSATTSVPSGRGTVCVAVKFDRDLNMAWPSIRRPGLWRARLSRKRRLAFSTTVSSSAVKLRLPRLKLNLFSLMINSVYIQSGGLARKSGTMLRSFN